MLLRVHWDGSTQPFEGERTIPVRTIPEGARIESARVKVTPVDPGSSFLERIDLTVPRPAWGANKVVGANFVEVDFRTRRTLASVRGSDLNGALLQIDPGGTYVEINDQGAIAGPGQPRFTFTDSSGGVLPSFVVARFKFTAPALAPTPDLSRVDIRSVPENVSLRIGDQPVFHTFLGTMTGPEETIDFASLLNEFLDSEEAVNGFFNFDLVVHSDTLARLQVDAEFDVQIEHKALQEGVGESVLGFQFDAIPAGAASSFRFDLPANAEALARRTAVRFQGAFDDTRIALGPLAPELTGGDVELHPASGRAQAQAQPFTPPANLNITGIDLLLKPKTERAEVRVDIRKDLGGKPGLDSLLAAPLPVSLLRDPPQSPHWVTITLKKELSLLGGEPLWLVVQSTLHEAAWSVIPSAGAGPGLQTTRDDALSWRAAHASGAPPLEALFRFRHRPPAFTMPIHVFVGEGAARKEVSLDRYEPLGRVDFTLDTDEFAAAINQAIAKSPAVGCLPVEHVVNGDLESWFRAGTDSQPPRPFPTIAGASDLFHAQAAVLSPTGDVAYLAAIEDRRPVIRRMDPFCGRLIDTARLSAAPGEGLLIASVAAGAGGRRLFVAAGNRVWTVDAGTMEELSTVSLANGVNVTAAAAAAGRVYFLSRPFTATSLQSEAFSVAESDIERPPSNGLPPPQTPAPSSPDASLIAVSPDGRTVVLLAAFATSGTGRLDIAAAGSAMTSIPLPFSPRGLTLSADGRTALLGTAAGTALHRVDLASRTVTAGASIGVQPAALSMAAVDGHRLAALEFSPAGVSGATGRPRLSVVDFGTPLPEAWTITAGSFLPVCLPDPFHIAGNLGGRSAENKLTPMSSVSQALPASSGCLYEFSFHAIATADGGFGEVIWRGGGCASTLTTRVPIQVMSAPAVRNVAVTLRLHRVRVMSPAGVTQAEVRFRVTEGVQAVVDRISLRPADGPLTNADFLETGGGAVPAGWTLTPAAAPGFRFTADGVENIGADPLQLSQQVTFEPATPFRLEVSGNPRSGAAPPVAAIHWLDVQADPVELILESPGTAAAAGVSPDAPARAEVSLMLPGGSAIRLDHFAVRTGLTAGVPISVFAETRGELTVSQFQVVTTERPAQPLPAPPGGLCPPSKPGAGEGEECGYCPCCGSEEATPSPAPTVVTICRQCGVTLPSPVQSRSGARKIAPLPRLVTGSRVSGRVTPPAVVEENAFLASSGAVPSPSPAPGGLRAHLSGVSIVESARLAAVGITTVSSLATADAATIARLLPSGSITRARLLIGLAKKHHIP